MVNTTKILVFLLADIMLVGCLSAADTYRNYDHDVIVKDGSPVGDLSTNTSPEVLETEAFREEDIPAEEEVAEIDQVEPLEGESDGPNIPMDMNDRVKKWIDYFAVKDHARFQRFLDRGEVFRPMIERILKENDMPAELYYLAMIESGFVTKARSHASAVGVWQFMRATGKRYGLKSSYYLDDRQDPIKATHAAAAYLRDLHNIFKSWHLAISAYNAGEFRIMTSIMRGNTRDYWKLVDKKILPRETSNYVPKFLAAITIGKNPKKYGFEINKSSKPELVEVSVASPVYLKDIAAASGVSYSNLKKNNSHLLRKMTPAGKKNYSIWATPSEAAKIGKAKWKIAAKRVKVRNTQIAASGWHKVRRGESLARIARKYGTTVAKIKKINGMRSSRIYANQRLRVTGTKAVARSSISGSVHKVRRGENLNSIARKYGTTIAKIKKLNGLRSSRIYPNQRLKVKGVSGQKKYRVRRGDNLAKISRKFGVSITRIKKLNRLRSNRIYAGQMIALNR